MISIFFLVLTAYVALCTAQPVEKLPVLKELPVEVLFRELQPTLLECVTEGHDKDVKYSWQKDGKPLALGSNVAQRSEEGSLVFLKPQAQDEGQYQCFAESSVGIASSRVVNFKRTYLAKPAVKVQDKTPVEGRSFKLECSIPKDSYPKPTIVWKKQLDASVSDTILDQRIIVSPEGDLYFTSVTKDDVSDRFRYVCLAKSPALDEEVPLAEYYIKSLTPDSNPKEAADLIPLYVSNDMMAKAGDITMIYCIFGGVPLAYPDWFKDGKNVNGKPGDRVTHRNRTAGKRLLIKDTNLGDEGTYTCEGNNQAGKPQKHTLKLTVVSGPKFAKKPERVIVAKQGQDVTVPCQVTGLPAPKVTWTHDGKPLSGKAAVTSDALTIKGVQKGDKGYYGCRAVNEHGDEYAETLVQVV